MCTKHIESPLPPSSPPFTPLSMWMESTVGITSPLRKLPTSYERSLMPSAGKFYPTIVPVLIDNYTSECLQITKKKPSIVNQQYLENKFKCKRCDAYYTGDTTYLLAWGSINTLHLKKQQKRAISRSWGLFLCAKATRLETVAGCLFTRWKKIPFENWKSVSPSECFPWN